MLKYTAVWANFLNLFLIRQLRIGSKKRPKSSQTLISVWENFLNLFLIRQLPIGSKKRPKSSQTLISVWENFLNLFLIRQLPIGSKKRPKSSQTLISVWENFLNLFLIRQLPIGSKKRPKSPHVKTFALAFLFIISFLVLSNPAQAVAVKLGRAAQDNLIFNNEKIPTRLTEDKQRLECVRHKDCLVGYKCNRTTSTCEDACLTMSYSNAQTCYEGVISNCPRGSTCACAAPMVADGAGNCFDPCRPSPCSPTVPTCTQDKANFTCSCTPESCPNAQKCESGVCRTCCTPEANGYCNGCTPMCHVGYGFANGGQCTKICTGCPNGQKCSGYYGTCTTCCTPNANSYCDGCSFRCNDGYSSSDGRSCASNCVAPANGYCLGITGSFSCKAGYIKQGSECIFQTCAMIVAGKGYTVVTNQNELVSALGGSNPNVALLQNVSINTGVVVGATQRIVGPNFFSESACKLTTQPSLSITTDSPGIRLRGEVSDIDISYTNSSNGNAAIEAMGTIGSVRNTTITLNPAQRGINVSSQEISLHGNITIKTAGGTTADAGIFNYKGQVYLRKDAILRTEGTMNSPFGMCSGGFTLQNAKWKNTATAHHELFLHECDGGATHGGFVYINDSIVYLNGRNAEEGHSLGFSKTGHLALNGKSTIYTGNNWRVYGFQFVSNPNATICISPKSTPAPGGACPANECYSSNVYIGEPHDGKKITGGMNFSSLYNIWTIPAAHRWNCVGNYKNFTPKF